MFKTHNCLFTFCCLLLWSCTVQQPIDLSGEWAFALDPDDTGITEQWYNQTLTGRIRLPGSLQEQGFGNDVDTATQWTGNIVDRSWYTAPEYEKYRQKGNIKIPFWLQPEKHYVGVAWYQRKIDIPASWKGKYIELELERTHWETILFVNGKEAGRNDALQTPHRYFIEATGTVLLSLRVDNRVHIPIGINAHSVTDHTQTNWNGIVGNITLTARPALYIDHIQVYPDVKNRKAQVVVTLAGKTEQETAKINIQGKRFNCADPKQLKTVNGHIEKNAAVYRCTLELGDEMRTWSEFEPTLYRLDVALTTKSGKDCKTTTFGMREFKAEGTRFQINGTPLFLRGTLECAIFPLTGYASMEADYWTKIYRRCKEFGLNHVRFHSWCPPRVAFETADCEGIYLQVECGGTWTHLGKGTTVDDWLYAESERIVQEFGNHPSFCMMAAGNEPSGENYETYLTRFVDYWKAKDARRVYTSAAGWPYIPNADYWSTLEPRIQAWDAGLNSIINAEAPRTDFDFRAITADKDIPVVSHEIGQWCVYPDLSGIAQYTGLLKAKNFEIYKETLEAHHLGDLAAPFLYASGRLQTLCYKADIEAALRTQGFGGFQLLDLHDFPGQGSALVGVLNPFWDSKGYVEGDEYSMFCNRTVPLARIRKLIWTNKETFTASIEVAHFDQQPLKQAAIEWIITDTSGKTLASGQSTNALPLDNCIEVTTVAFDLKTVTAPAQLILKVKIPGLQAANRWDFWVYPVESTEIPGKPYFTTNYHDAVTAAQAGANVLYCLPKEALKAEKGGDIKVGFSCIFWNTAWFNKQPPHTLGIYCDASHPVFEGFPNEGYSNYQWWEVVTGSQAMVMDAFPAGFRPLVYHIDDWFTNRKLGLLFETKAGKGKLMVCSADITNDLDKRHAARQFRHSIEQYMASDQFNPATELDLEIVKDLLQ